MRMIPAFFALLVALPLGAQTLQVNALPMAALENDASLTISEAPMKVARGETVLLEAKLTFSRPSEDPTAEEFAGDRFAVAAKADGTLVVYDGSDELEEISLTVEDGETVSVKVAAYWGKDEDGADEAVYEVRFEKADGTVAVCEVGTVANPGHEGDLAEALTLSEVCLEGEGKAEGLALAHVPTGILPSDPGMGSQDPARVAKYAAWLNAADKGGAMASASDAERSDAFAMNVGGKPSLAITAVEPRPDGTVVLTVKGSYAKAGEGEAEAPLKAINGMVYVTYAGTLDGEPKVESFEVTVAPDGSEQLTIPADKGARFLKASVSFVTPEAKL